MSGEHHEHHGEHHHEHKGNDTFFEDSTVAIGFVYTIIALAIIVTLYAIG